MQPLVDLFLSDAERDALDPILDTCVAVYKEKLDEDGQVEFKGKAKSFAALTISSPRCCPTRIANGRNFPSS